MGTPLKSGKKSDECMIRLLPHGRTIAVEKGGNLLRQLYERNIFLRTDCGGKGGCGKCRIVVVSGEGRREEQNCCRLTVEGDMTIEIPLGSLLSPEVIGKAPVRLPENFLNKLGKSVCREGFGIAVDLGTTTIAIYLVDTGCAEILASLSLKNPQALYGDDVMSRIARIAEDENNLAHLQTLAVKTIELGVTTLLKKYHISHEALQDMVVVGNPTMIHLFLGVDPQSIGHMPYHPAFSESRVTPGAELGFEKLRFDIHTLPQISGFLGGDLLSAAIAADIDHEPPGTLLIDIGTNGELILQSASGLYATSCATGPAFEGATLSCGMQAVSGAIDEIVIEDRQASPRCSVLSRGTSPDQQRPAGICGSGIISGMAELVRRGIVESSGAFSRQPNIARLLNGKPRNHRYLLFGEQESDSGREICISQKDIRAIQLGKGALITGIEFLMRWAGIERLERIILAGAFGSHLKPEDLMAMGMIPEIERSKVIVAGNLAGTGAVMALCDQTYRRKAGELAGTVININLAEDPEFQLHFVKRLAFPAR